jgi:hypothetical protein
VTEKKGWGSTVLGWFIVHEDAGDTAGADTPASAVPTAGASDAAAGTADALTPAIFQNDPPPPATDGQVAFDEVFDAAGVDADERERVVKAQQLLGSLPVETPVAIRKQIVEASLKAFGVPIENIIEAGVAEIQALEGYIRKNAADTQQVLQESNGRIAQFEDEIRRLRARMEQQVRQQHGIAAACNARKLDIQQVLEFFGQEAVARVVQASPRLHDPSASDAGAETSGPAAS